MKKNQNNKHKFVIGTAQFGSDYGISNDVGLVRSNEVEKILDVAKIHGIDTLDTAISYGNAEKTLGLIGVDDFSLITKIPSFNCNHSVAKSTIFGFIENSLRNLSASKLYAVLLHDPSILLGSIGDSVFSAMCDLKSAGYTSKIGVSSYSPNQIIKISDRYNIDIIQAPMNLVDRRLEESGCLQYLRQKNIEIHIRSIFLQGLLLMQKEVIPSQFSKWTHLWDHWENWHKVTGYSKLNACISYPLYCDEVDKIIIGIESSSQLEEILRNMDEISISEMPNLANDSQDLINPSKWIDQKK